MAQAQNAGWRANRGDGCVHLDFMGCTVPRAPRAAARNKTRPCCNCLCVCLFGKRNKHDRSEMCTSNMVMP
jgi:hypothetical protein